MFTRLQNIDPSMAVIVITLLTLLTGLAYALAFGSSSVSLNSKRWTCTASRPVGITAECTMYELKDRGVR